MEKPPQIQAGPKKVIDCKIDENGRQFYKVKWETTWEPAENLRTCQHLIDEFWFFVFSAKKVAPARNEKPSDQCTLPAVPCELNQMTLQKLSHQEKSDVHELINRTATTSADMEVFSSLNYDLNVEAPVVPPMIPSPVMMSPPQTPVKSEIIPIPVQQQGSPLVHRFPQSPPVNPANPANPVKKEPNFGENSFLPTPKTLLNAEFTPTKQEKSPKMGRQLEMDISGKSGTNADKSLSNAGCLKIIQSFSHPYVKLHLVCKICDKEASLKFPHTWKRHYISHSNEKTPQKQVGGTPPPQKKKRASKSENMPPVVMYEEC